MLKEGRRTLNSKERVDNWFAKDQCGDGIES